MFGFAHYPKISKYIAEGMFMEGNSWYIFIPLAVEVEAYAAVKAFPKSPI